MTARRNKQGILYTRRSDIAPPPTADGHRHTVQPSSESITVKDTAYRQLPCGSKREPQANTFRRRRTGSSDLGISWRRSSAAGAEERVHTPSLHSSPPPSSLHHHASHITNGVDLTGLLGGHKGRLGDESPPAGSGAVAVSVVTVSPLGNTRDAPQSQLCGNMASSSKPEVHNGSQRRQRRTVPQSQTTCTDIW